VERIVLEGIANPKQSSVLCLLLNSLGVLSRYPLHGSEDGGPSFPKLREQKVTFSWIGMTLLGTVLESSIGDLNWIINSTQDYKNNCIAMLVLLLKVGPVHLNYAQLYAPHPLTDSPDRQPVTEDLPSQRGPRKTNLMNVF